MHVLELLAPKLAEKYPGLHRSQAPCPSSSSKVPAGHNEHEELLARENLPTGHVRHVSSEIAPKELEAVPAGQDVHCAVLFKPSVGPYDPAGQSVQDDDPTKLNFPAGHATHDDMLLALTVTENVPAGHEEHVVEELTNMPAGQLMVQFESVQDATADVWCSGQLMQADPQASL